MVHTQLYDIHATLLYQAQRFVTAISNAIYATLHMARAHVHATLGTRLYQTLPSVILHCLPVS